MNTEKLKGYWEKVKAALGKVSKKIWIIIAVTVAVLVIGVVVFLNTRPYATLIAGATDEEVATVQSWLQEQGVTDYKVEGSGAILVPKAQAPALKARLLQERYSQPNTTYSGYFERVGALSTESERGIAELDSLIDSYEKTIRQFPGVQDVGVTINLGEDHRYVLDSDNRVEATAGVMLYMQNGRTLTDGQANAIRNYIASGVAGLDVKNVTIQDSDGHTYDGTASGVGTAQAASALKLQLEREWKDRIEDGVYKYLASIYGEDNVTVTANCTVELGDKTVNDYVVHLPKFAEGGETNGAGIIGTRFYNYQVRVGDDVAAGGIVGTSSNSDLPTYVEEGETLAEALARLVGEGQIDYDNSKTQTKMIITAGTLTNVTVAVGIDSVTNPMVNVDRVSAAVASASGIEAPLELPEGMTAEEYLARRITVLNEPFYRAPEPQPEPTFFERLGIPEWVVYAALGGLLLFLIILVTVILLVRRGRKKKQAAEQKAVEELLATAMPGQALEIGPDGQAVVQPVLDEDGNPVAGADVMELHTERSMELRQGIRDFVDENMEVAALLIKSWLKEDGDNG